MPIDGLLLGVMTVAIGLSVVALVLVAASLPSGRRGVTPPPVHRSGHTYTCLCWSAPVRVTVRPATKGREAGPPVPRLPAWAADGGDLLRE